MTTDNQTTNSIEVTTYSKVSTVGRNVTSKAVDKSTAVMKTLSLRPTKSFKKNNSLMPTKKLRSQLAIFKFFVPIITQDGYELTYDFIKWKPYDVGVTAIYL